MSDKIKVSIITINFNNKEGLKKTMGSVFNQLYQNYEYIIIDGGSTDGSKEEIEFNASKIDFWISEKDNGIYDAMNKGIIKATGEYCYFLNSGDFLLNNNVITKTFESAYQSDIIYGNMVPEGLNRIEHGMREISFYNFFIGSIYHQAAFIKRELFNAIGLYNQQYKVVADWDFFLRAIFLHNCTTTYLNLEIASYEIGGLSFQNPKSNLEDRRQILEKNFPLFVNDYDELVKIRTSKIAGIHNILQKNKFIYTVLSFIISFTQFVRFDILKMQRGTKKYI